MAILVPDGRAANFWASDCEGFLLAFSIISVATVELPLGKEKMC